MSVFNRSSVQSTNRLLARKGLRLVGPALDFNASQVSRYDPRRQEFHRLHRANHEAREPTFGSSDNAPTSGPPLDSPRACCWRVRRRLFLCRRLSTLITRPESRYCAKVRPMPALYGRKRRGLAFWRHLGKSPVVDTEARRVGIRLIPFSGRHCCPGSLEARRLA
jgi:hypothetical protein